MTITGVANLAVKVGDIAAAVDFYRCAGAEVTDPEQWRNGRRADVHLGPLQITLFTHAVYEDDLEGLPDEGFLHVALFTDDLDREVEGRAVVWGPEIVSGPTFGTRRIAFVNAPGNMRLELMEQLEEPA
jgi:catechol 2,3-dioxygenase-like lactoylglutathione lyase family enzyme